MEASYFDGRSKNYDADETHRRIVSLLIGGVRLQPGDRVLDTATGTGAVALKAAESVGSTGMVLGIDVSSGMLEVARKKAAAAGVDNVAFRQADAEQIDLPHGRFDLILCASGLIFLSDVPAALCRWFALLKPAGVIDFNTPAKPFGLSERVAVAAASQNVCLAYDYVADTPLKCRTLLHQAGFEAIEVRTELVNASPVTLIEAIAFWEERLDHPAWRSLKEAPQAVRNTARAQYFRDIRAQAVNGFIPNETAENFAYGRKPPEKPLA